MLDGLQANVLQQAEQLRPGGFVPGGPGLPGPLGPAPNPSVRGWEAEPRPIGRQQGRRGRWAGGPRSRTGGPRSSSDDPEQEIANLVIGAAAGAIGRAVGNRLQRAYAERIVPALQAQLQQTAGERAAIVERYPELRGCMRDRVLFLAGGAKTVPTAEIRMPVTLVQADALVARLRAS